MRVLVTGARGFMGQNLVASLEAIRDGKDRRPQYQQLLPAVEDHGADNRRDEGYHNIQHEGPGRVLGVDVGGR